MQIGDRKWREQRERIKRRDKEAPRPLAPSGRPYHEVRCHKCGQLLALVERMMPGDFTVLPPGEAPADPETRYSSPDPAGGPAETASVVLWCVKCRERRFTHSAFPPAANGKRKP